MLVVFLSAGLAIFLVTWLNVHQAQGLAGYEPGFFAAVRNGTFIVDEGYHESGDVVQASLRALTFSSVASHVVGLTSSFLMTLVAYRTASQWIESSRRLSEGARDQNPTPVQYGLLVGLLGASNIMSLYKAIRYALRSKEHRSKLPSIFVEPLIIASVVLALNHALGVSDLWLHTTARSAVIMTAVPGGASDLSTVKLGVAFNESICDPSVPGSPTVSSPCLAFAHGWASGSWPWIIPNAWLVLSNSTSAPVRVINLANQNNTAVMVPAGVQALNSRTSMSHTFTAPTLAVRSNCKVITGACIRDKWGNVADCTPAGTPYLPLKWDFTRNSPPACNFTIPACFPNRIFGVVDGQTGSFVSNTYQSFGPNLTLPSGPVTLGMQLRLNQDNVVYLEPPEWAVDPGFRLFGTCEVEYLNGSLTYDPSENEYKLVNEAHVPGNLTATLWGPLISQYVTNRLISDITGLVMGDPSIDPTKLINANLARIALGALGGVVQPVVATQASLVRQGVFGLYPVAPVLCVSGILYAYALFAMFIFFSSVSSKSYTVSTTASPKEDGMEEDPASSKSSDTTNEETALVLGQLWLTDPLPLVAAVFSRHDGKDPQRSIANDSLDMVYDTDGKAGRLIMGVTAIGDETRFGLKRREKNFRGSYDTL